MIFGMSEAWVFTEDYTAPPVVGEYLTTPPSVAKLGYQANRVHEVRLDTFVREIEAELARAGSDAEWLRWTVVLSSLGQILGLAVYFWTMWPRIRPVGSHLREAKGEKF